jgi:hypothetical protein
MMSGTRQSYLPFIFETGASPTMPTLAATIESSAGRRAVALPVRELVLAGWTGRDKAAVEHHIREL